MSDCSGCSTLERRLDGLGADLRRAQDERDRAVERASPTADQRDRHTLRLVCDRCGASLSVASTLEIPESELRQSIGDLARRVRWSLGRATARELVLEADGERDLCPVCTMSTSTSK
jgi:hypothetical protein